MFDARAVAVVAAGAALGGVVRYGIGTFVSTRFGIAFVPLATMAINLSGSFAIGIVLEVALGRGALSPLWRAFLATGVLGGFTTFSAFSAEALAYATGGAFPLAVAYVTASAGLGVVAAFAGSALARAF